MLSHGSNIILTVTLAIALFATLPTRAQTANKDTVTVSWDPPAQGDPPVAGYVVYFSQSWTNWTHRKFVALSPSPKATVDLTALGSWYFIVSATNAAGLESGPSNLLAYEVQTPPATNRTLRLLSAIVTRTSTITTSTNIITVP